MESEWKPNCDGNHNLIEILSCPLGYNESKTVRWCTRCGAVVIDQDFDGRTNAGRYMKMIRPCYK